MPTTQVFIYYSNIFLELLLDLKSKVLKRGSIKKEQNVTISDQRTIMCSTERILGTTTHDWQESVPKHNCSHQNTPRCVFLFETYTCLKFITGNSGQAPLLEVFLKSYAQMWLLQTAGESWKIPPKTCIGCQL